MVTIEQPLTTAEVAKAFGVDRRTIINWIASGRLVPIFRAGQNSKAGYLFDAAEIEALASAKAAS